MKSFRALFAPFLVALFFVSVPAQAQDIPSGSNWQCVTFARAFSGIQIFGKAGTWWGQAAGKYDRGHAPKVGAVMAMPGHAGMRVGHVATVSDIVDARTIKVTHANWSRRGRVEQDVTVIDVSAGNDWSRVRVWYGPMNGLGLTAYPVQGFIYAGKSELPRAQIASADTPADKPIRLASLKLD